METFKILHKLTPVYLQDLASYKNSAYSENLVDLPRGRTTKLGKSTLCYVAAVVWNSLPIELRKVDDYEAVLRANVQCANLLNLVLFQWSLFLFRFSSVFFYFFLHFFFQIFLYIYTLMFFFFFVSMQYMLIGPGHAKTCLMPYANNKSADQPAHPRSLISTLVVRWLDSMICMLAISKVSRF